MTLQSFCVLSFQTNLYCISPSLQLYFTDFTTYFLLFVYAARLFIIFIGIMVLSSTDSFILHLYTYIFCSRLSLLFHRSVAGLALQVWISVYDNHTAGQQGLNFLVILVIISYNIIMILVILSYITEACSTCE